VLESEYLLDVQFVCSLAVISCDLVDQHGHFRHWRVHPIEQAQPKWQRDTLQSLGPIGLDLPIFNLLRACDDCPKPWPLDCETLPQGDTSAKLPLMSTLLRRYSTLTILITLIFRPVSNAPDVN
jgi:hypothetical protein